MYRLPDDNSILGKACMGNQVKTMVHSPRLYGHLILLDNANYILLEYLRYECDDYKEDNGFDKFGTWFYYVR